MVTGMATTKITITLPDEQIQAIRESVAKGTFRSVSAYVQRAIEQTLDDSAAFRAMLNESLDATGGPMTAEEIAYADEILNRQARKNGSGNDGASDEKAA
jgi:hypothetical protein